MQHIIKKLAQGSMHQVLHQSFQSLEGRVGNPMKLTRGNDIMHILHLVNRGAKPETQRFFLDNGVQTFADSVLPWNFLERRMMVGRSKPLIAPEPDVSTGP